MIKYLINGKFDFTPLAMQDILKKPEKISQTRTL